jgi:glutaryl-CoA dehydrogenase
LVHARASRRLHVNNLESVFTYEGAQEVHTLLVVEVLTGENAFR